MEKLTRPEGGGMIPPCSKVLCAVSGGADSVCLLHMLSRREDITLHAAHFNHQLRGEEADRDEVFVRDICARWNIPLTVGREDVRVFSEREGLSLEEGGRILRYAFLKGAAQTEGCGLIATAHNADDNAETVLLNLIRGSGLKGLGGIPPVQGSIVRPLLSTTRADIEAYLDTYHLPHVEDSTNTDERYTRNKVRRQLMPLLQELNPKAAEHINTAAAQLAEAQRYLEESARPYLAPAQIEPGRVRFPMKALRQAPAALRPHILLQLFDALPVGRKDMGAVHLEAVLGLKEGRQLDLPHGLTVSCREGVLEVTVAALPPPDSVLLPHVPLRWGEWRLTVLDKPQGQGLALRAGGVLTVGHCPAGERLTLPGSNGPRTVKRLCKDRNLPPARRDLLPALYVDGRLAAVWPLGVDVAFLPEKGNGWFIQIEYTEKDEQT